MLSLIELLNRILAFIQSAMRKKKQEEAQDAYEKINKNLKDSVASSDVGGDDGVFTPNGKAPASSDLRDDTEVK